MKNKEKFKLKNSSAKKLPNTIVSSIGVNHYVALGIILILTFITYLPVLHNEFLNWDDGTYIQNNPLITSINFKEIFTKPYFGNYHPLTILIYAIEYHFFGLNETGFHAVNLILHLFNVALVFFAIYLLGKKVEIALVVALLFGIHPIHVESVAWVSELKDVLCAFFFLAAFIFYLKYLKNKSVKFYVFSLLFFLFALLSKAMAVSFPLVMLLTDYFIRKDSYEKKGIINYKALFEKIPFFALSLVFGIIAVFAQKSSGYLHDISFYTFPQRLIFACYGFITYLLKLALPINLSAFYPYPIKSGEVLPVQYYFYLIIFLALIALVIYSIRFSKKLFIMLAFLVSQFFLCCNYWQWAMQ